MEDATNTMYDYLINKYPKATVEKLDNGGYFVTLSGTRGDQIYVPAEFNSDSVSVMSYFPGSGGNKATDANQVRALIYSDNPPNTIITIAKDYYDPGKVMMQASSIAHDNNLEVSNVGIQTFSASGPVGFSRLEDFMEVNPNAKATIVVADGFGNYGNYNTHNDFLIENDVDVIYVLPDERRGDFYSTIEKMGKSGVSTYIMISDRNVGSVGYHMNINNDLVKNGFLLYTLGLTDELSGPTLDKCNYSLRVYDPTNPNADKHGFVIMDSMDEIRQENASFGYNLSRLDSNPFVEGTVASDMYLTVNSINNIRNSMGINLEQGHLFDSTSTIPNSLFVAESSLIGISSDLTGNLAKETEVIASIAQVFYDMDRERTNAVNQLGGTFDVLGYSNAIDQLINENLSGITTFDSFMFDPGSHIEGNSGKLYLNDLTSLVSGSSLNGVLYENLENERETASKTKNEIDNLINLIQTSENFQGEAWKKVLEKLNTYSELMTLRIYSVGILEHAMVKALNLLISYMENYDSLDDSRLNELRGRIEELKQSIIDSQEIINATHTVKVEEETNGNMFVRYQKEYVHSLETRTNAKTTLENSKVLLDELMKEVAKLEGMSVVIAQAEQIINDALSEIYSKYASKVSEIVTGSTVSYIPPSNTVYTSSVNTYISDENEKENTFLQNLGKYFTTGHVSENLFNNNEKLREKYGSYEDYLNGVEAINNPEYNPELNPDVQEKPDNDQNGGDKKPDDNQNDVDKKPDNNQNDGDKKPDDNQNDGDKKTDDNQNDVDKKPDDNQNDGDKKPDDNQNDGDKKPDDNQSDGDKKPDDNQNDGDKKPDDNQNDGDKKPDDNQNDGDKKPDDNQNDGDKKPDDNQNDVDKKPDDNQNDGDKKPDDNQNDVDKKPDDNQNDGDKKPDDNQNDGDKKPDDNQNDVDKKPDDNQNDGDKKPDDNQNGGDKKPDNDQNDGNKKPDGLQNSVGGSTQDNLKPPISNKDNNNILNDEIIKDNQILEDNGITSDDSVIPPIENNNQIGEVPPIIDIEVDEIIDITPPSVNNDNDMKNSNSLAKKVGIGIGGGAAVGAVTLGAHTYIKAKENDIYEDDEEEAN